jgi:hypothetical protein
LQRRGKAFSIGTQVIIFLLSLLVAKKEERACRRASAANNGLRELETRRLRYTNFDQQKTLPQFKYPSEREIKNLENSGGQCQKAVALKMTPSVLDK